MKSLAGHLAYIAGGLAFVLSFVVPGLPWMSGLAQWAMLFALVAVWIGLRRIAPRKEMLTDLELRIARNRKYWDEFDQLIPDPLFRSGVEVWVPPSLASTKGSDGSRYREELLEQRTLELSIETDRLQYSGKAR